MARVVTKIGDLFSIQIDSQSRKYFQYVENDLTQRNSDVIRCFNTRYSINSTPPIADIVRDTLEFYAHAVVGVGVKMGLWEKVGKSDDLGMPSKFLFRGSKGSGCKVGEEPVKISHRWYVWRTIEEFREVGKLN